ncbi:hypothetical protein DFH08DRAFT_956354 [Mycena albidolilacea]|uniref:Uncharacterized protein n=1 Tax=Mycena albidolilacea TaxID=1033008 RepID=A0AAD7AAT8_9AGAR|nr:hypothetical protein DFH08DRAFT_956354 [Mycena albidolilacea]
MATTGTATVASVFTYNKYTQITARAENGEGGVQTMLVPELAKDPKQGSAAV